MRHAKSGKNPTHGTHAKAYVKSFDFTSLTTMHSGRVVSVPIPVLEIVPILQKMLASVSATPGVQAPSKTT